MKLLILLGVLTFTNIAQANDWHLARCKYNAGQDRHLCKMYAKTAKASSQCERIYRDTLRRCKEAQSLTNSKVTPVEVFLVPGRCGFK